MPKKPIQNDRGLLIHLKLSDTDAARFIGRSRETLVAGLGPKKKTSQPPPSDYFSMASIAVLVESAAKLGREIDPEAILDYVDRTRSDGKSGEAYEMLLKNLQR